MSSPLQENLYAATLKCLSEDIVVTGLKKYIIKFLDGLRDELKQEVEINLENMTGENFIKTIQKCVNIECVSKEISITALKGYLKKCFIFLVNTMDSFPDELKQIANTDFENLTEEDIKKNIEQFRALIKRAHLIHNSRLVSQLPEQQITVVDKDLLWGPIYQHGIDFNCYRVSWSTCSVNWFTDINLYSDKPVGMIIVTGH